MRTSLMFFFLVATATNFCYGQSNCEPCKNWPKSCDLYCLFAKLKAGSISEWKLLLRALPDSTINELYAIKERINPNDLSYSTFTEHLSNGQIEKLNMGLNSLNKNQVKYLKKPIDERRIFIANYEMIKGEI